jgi:lipopolysaccharide/colanic/teichoic acid biosynthesis glycosyltransferase
VRSTGSNDEVERSMLRFPVHTRLAATNRESATLSSMLTHPADQVCDTTIDNVGTRTWHLAAGARLPSDLSWTQARTVGWYRRSKRALDVILASIALAVSAPLMGILALVIRLDSPGPAFFRQIRVGEGGRLFTMIKLRTMYETSPLYAERADLTELEVHRITRIGSHLRRWSLDELPQLINVLRGDMSLVGPRPERPEIVLTRYERWQFERFRVPQGMTGWWQITDRGKTRLCDDTANDLYYVARASFWFDLRILLRTLPAVARQARSV